MDSPSLSPRDIVAPQSAASRRGAPKRSFAARLFGYDIFISFALGPPPRGTHSYASDLARRLRERDFNVFFSEDEAPPGENLDSTLRSALLRSKTLVVIANRGTLEDPRWVRTEVEEFRNRHLDRPVIPINVGSALQDPVLAAGAQEWLSHEGKIWVDETEEAVATGLASEAVAERLATAPTRATANMRWRWVVTGFAVTLALLVVGAGAAAWVAQKNAEEAARQRIAAELNLKRAEEALAESERELLRAQRAELRGLALRLDGLLAQAQAAGKASKEMVSLETERRSVADRLARTTHLYQTKLAEQIGFRGDFEFLMKWEGQLGRVMLLGSDIGIDPFTSLGEAKPEEIQRRYEFILTPGELQAVVGVTGKRGAEAQKAYSENPIFKRIRIEPSDVAGLVPEALDPWWRTLQQRYPVLNAPDTPGAVHTALLSLSIHIGSTGFKRLTPLINGRKWLELADAIESIPTGTRHTNIGLAQFVRARRAAEAALIRNAMATRAGT